MPRAHRAGWERRAPPLPRRFERDPELAASGCGAHGSVCSGRRRASIRRRMRRNAAVDRKARRPMSPYRHVEGYSRQRAIQNVSPARCKVLIRARRQKVRLRSVRACGAKHARAVCSAPRLPRLSKWELAREVRAPPRGYPAPRGVLANRRPAEPAPHDVRAPPGRRQTPPRQFNG